MVYNPWIVYQRCNTVSALNHPAGGGEGLPQGDVWGCEGLSRTVWFTARELTIQGDMFTRLKALSTWLGVIKLNQDSWNILSIKLNQDSWNILSIKLNQDSWNILSFKLNQDSWNILSFKLNQDPRNIFLSNWTRTLEINFLSNWTRTPKIYF